MTILSKLLRNRSGCSDKKIFENKPNADILLIYYSFISDFMLSHWKYSYSYLEKNSFIYHLVFSLANFLQFCCAYAPAATALEVRERNLLLSDEFKTGPPFGSIKVWKYTFNRLRCNMKIPSLWRKFGNLDQTVSIITSLRNLTVNLNFNKILKLPQQEEAGNGQLINTPFKGNVVFYSNQLETSPLSSPSAAYFDILIYLPQLDSIQSFNQAPEQLISSVPTMGGTSGSAPSPFQTD